MYNTNNSIFDSREFRSSLKELNFGLLKLRRNHSGYNARKPKQYKPTQVQTDMKTARTANPDSDTATAENGLHLMAALATGINRLHLSRSEMVELTRPANLSKLLAGMREQPEVPPVTSFRTKSCTLTQRTSNTNSPWTFDEKLLSAAPWIQYSDANGSEGPLTEDHLEKLNVVLPGKVADLGDFTHPLDKVIECKITANEGWAIEVFRDAFQFYGPESILAKAILARNTVWNFREIMTLIANIVHDPKNDPLGLQELEGGALFPVLTSSPFEKGQENWSKLDPAKILGSITWLNLYGRCGKHLGKSQWGFRIFRDMKYVFSKRLGEHDVALGKDRHSLILFRDDPRPRQKKGSHWENNQPEVYGE